MLNGNGALDTATHRLLERMRAELESARRGHDAEPPTEEVRVEVRRLGDEPSAAGSG